MSDIVVGERLTNPRALVERTRDPAQHVIAVSPLLSAVERGVYVRVGARRAST